MATISCSKDTLHVNMGFWERFGSLSRNLTIPLSNVRGATDDPSFIKDGSLGLRSGGTGFPGLIAEGHFRKNGDKLFALWRRGEQIVVIELQNEKWDRLVLGCSDAHALAQEINNSK
ncbi:hypothetical protein [Aurantimicrobium minutum]|uniref:hypothetical protein n=1 Tax=Aurantimicrobium minutum TaxID=708131 RepID=UPI00248E39AB|nr:hypothetical protein [Aurantimicrobium minutum]